MLHATWYSVESLGGWLFLTVLVSTAYWAGYDKYWLLDLYSGFFWPLVPYSENLLLDRVASSSKKAQIFQNILFLDTDNKVFGFISFFLVTHFCKSAICVHLASCCFHFLWGFHERNQCLNFKTDSIAKINWTIMIMMGAKNENWHQTNGLHTLL